MNIEKEVRKKLIDKDKSQKWLIEEIKKKTGMFCDNSILFKVLRGKVKSERMLNAISEILNLKLL